MAKRREYDPSATPAKVGVAVVGNLLGRLPAGAADNALVQVYVMQRTTSATNKYAGLVGDVNTVWKAMVKELRYYGMQAAMLRILLAEALKFRPRPGGGLAQCTEVTAALTASARRARMDTVVADGIDRVAKWVRDNGWCMEAAAGIPGT
mgnify:CR=1 FL=1